MGSRSVIVTGGRGRLGRLLVSTLRSNGVRTLSLARSKGESRDDVAVDLRDADAVADIVGGNPHDVIVHLASELRGDHLITDNDLMDQAIARASRRFGTSHVVNVSSAAVYGTESEVALREEDPLIGTSAYARSKILGETTFRTLAGDGVTSVTTLRVFNVAGPGFPHSLVMRLLNATTGDPVPLTQPDHFVRDYLHQSDAVAILLSALSKSPSGHRTLNAAGGVPVSTRMLMKVLDIAPGQVIELPGQPSANWADVTRMEKELGVRAHTVPDVRWAMGDLGALGARRDMRSLP